LRSRILLGLAALFTILSSLPLAAPTGLESKRAIIGELTAKEKRILAQLEEISHKINQKSAEIDALNEEIARKKLLLRRLSEKLNSREAELQELQRRFQERLKHLSTMGELGWINLILSPQEISAFFRRQEYTNLIFYHDRKLAQKIQREKKEIERQKEIVRQEKEHLDALKARYESEIKALQSLKREKEILLEEVRRNKRLYAETLHMLEKAYAAISQMAEELKRTREELEVTKKEFLKIQKKKAPPKPAPLLELKGLLPPPIEGEVLKFFGLEVDPLTGEKIFHQGITIAAPVGSPVRAPYAGEIIKISLIREKGFLVFIDHGYHFLSVIGGLGKVSKGLGEHVSTGEIIGEVGEAPFGKGGVYYELRYQGKPQNPLDWLDTSKLKFLR